MYRHQKNSSCGHSSTESRQSTDDAPRMVYSRRTTDRCAGPLRSGLTTTCYEIKMSQLKNRDILMLFTGNGSSHGNAFPFWFARLLRLVPLASPPFLPISAMCSRFRLTVAPPFLAISRCRSGSIEAKPRLAIPPPWLFLSRSINFV